MDQATQEAVLAHMAYRVVGNRRRQHAETIALRLLHTNGQVTGDEVAAALAAEWSEPDPQEVANLVARKCAAAAAYHAVEAAEAGTAVDRAERAVARALERLAAAEARLAQAVQGQAVEEAQEAQAAAEALLALAVEQGADPGLAPGGADAAAAAQVAEAVGDAIDSGGA